MESYKFLQAAETSKVFKMRFSSVFVVDKAKTPELYEATLNDEYKLPFGVMIVLKDGEEIQSAVGDGESVFSASITVGGEGDGSGVTWNQVADKPLYTLGTPMQDAEGLIPVYTQNGQLPVGMPEFPENAVPLILLDVRVPELEQGNFLVGGTGGNEGRGIQPSDVGFTGSGTGARVITHQGTNWVNSYLLGSGATGSTLAFRTATGQGKFSPSSATDEAVVQSQFEGLVNDTLTNAETSASLNTAYPNVVVGFTVTTVTGLTEYRKISPTVWTKKTIESI